MLDPARVSYQWTLRQIGGFLDSRAACRPTVIEVPDGFVLRYQVGVDDASTTVVHFPRRQLISRDVQQERMRLQLAKQGTGGGPAAGASVGPAQRHVGGYQDFFRALGYELDQTSVYNVALDELPDGLLVTYLHVDARLEYVPMKKMVWLRDEQKRQIIEDAHARRQQARDASSRLKIFS